MTAVYENYFHTWVSELLADCATKTYRTDGI